MHFCTWKLTLLVLSMNLTFYSHLINLFFVISALLLHSSWYYIYFSPLYICICQGVYQFLFLFLVLFLHFIFSLWTVNSLQWSILHSKHTNRTWPSCNISWNGLIHLSLVIGIMVKITSNITKHLIFTCRHFSFLQGKL